jgi:hypothetical protein
MSTIVRKKLSDIASVPQTDWERVDALAEQQVRDNASQDNDSFLADKAFWQDRISVHRQRLNSRDGEAEIRALYSPDGSM